MLHDRCKEHLFLKTELCDTIKLPTLLAQDGIDLGSLNERPKSPFKVSLERR